MVWKMALAVRGGLITAALPAAMAATSGPKVS